MAAHFLSARRNSPGFGGKFEDLFGRLNTLLGLENAQKIKSAEFNDSLAVAHGNPLQNCCFFAQQHAALGAKQPVWLLDDLHGRTFAQMRAEEKDAVSHRGRAFRALAVELARRREEAPG